MNDDDDIRGDGHGPMAWRYRTTSGDDVLVCETCECVDLASGYFDAPGQRLDVVTIHSSGESFTCAVCGAVVVRMLSDAGVGR